MSASQLFYEPNTTTNVRVRVPCSENERRVYGDRSMFFLHPLFNGEEQLNWPQKTHLVCRYDGEQFDTIPIPLPVDYNHLTNTYTCYGMFCSPNCAKAFMESNSLYSNALSMIWLKRIMIEVFGHHQDIIPAPPVDMLQKHGGELSIVQFRNFAAQQVTATTHILPFFPCILAFELWQKEQSKNANNKATAADKGTEERTMREERKIANRITRQKRLAAAVATAAAGVQPQTSPLSQTPDVLSSSSLPPLSQLSTSSSLPPLSQLSTSSSLPPLSLSSPQPQTPSMVGVEYFKTPSTSSADQTMFEDDENIKDPYDSDTLLPDSICLVSANQGNEWEIRGLKRPEQPIQVQSFHQKPGKVSLYEEYLARRSEKNKTDAIADSSSSSSTSMSNVLSPALATLTSHTSMTNTDPISTNGNMNTSQSSSQSASSPQSTSSSTSTPSSTLEKPNRRRGRPKATGKLSATNANFHTPPMPTTQGNLSQFLSK